MSPNKPKRPPKPDGSSIKMLQDAKKKNKSKARVASGKKVKF